MDTPTLLIVADDDLIRRRLRERLAHDGYALVDLSGDAPRLETVAAAADLVLLVVPEGDDHVMPAALTRAEVDVRMIEDSIDPDDAARVAQRALDNVHRRREVGGLRTAVVRDCRVEDIIGQSPAMLRAKALIARVAASPASTVLITGETGTGKDMVARVIHANSDRAGKPFVNVTCSAMPEHLLESELFGHERGAFTDAHQQKRGLIETADTGTVFLDEIGEMPPTLQAKLLRFLEEKTFKRVGGLADIHVDVRVIAATNRDLASQVATGKCREDLYYRLLVMPVALPALRDRTGDISLLIDYFVARFNDEFRTSVCGVSAEALALLEGHEWSGNVRELRNAIERAVLLADGEWLMPGDFSAVGVASGAAAFHLPANGINLRDLEKQLVVQALERCGGNQTRAGQLLGINRDQVRYRILKFGLTVV